MKNFILVMLSFILFFSCDQRTEEQKAKERIESEISNAAAPYIASDFAKLKVWVAMAKDENVSESVRSNYIEKMRKEFPQYLFNTSLNNINSPKFDDNLKKTKEYITAKRRAQVLGVSE